MKPSKHSRLSLALAHLVLAAAAIGSSVNAAAQSGPGVTVNDPVSIEKQIAEYAEQAKRWADTLKQYQQFISTITGFSFQSLLPTQQLQKMDEQQMAKMACPGSGNMITDIFSAVTSINLNGPIAESAQRLCAMTAIIKVKMYNETVDQANRVPEYSSQITKITDMISRLLGSSSSVGDTQKLQLEATKLQGQFDQEMKAYDTKIKGYQSMLTTLKDAQSMLASIAMRGGQNASMGSAFGKAMQ